MSEQGPYVDRPEHRYDETVKPTNPPNSVLRPAVRRTAVSTYLGILVVTFLIVGAAFLVWKPIDGSRLPDGQGVADPETIGTSGERMPREDTPGGFDPAPQHGSTRSEVEFRGGGEPPQGAMPGLTAAPLTSVGALNADSVGRRIELQDAEVERSQGGSFQVRDGGATVTVLAPGGMPTVQEGQRVNVSGTVEREGDGVRIRANRIEVR